MKISVITVCYNSEKTIERTIRSVLEQTHSDIEYIIIDGGSKDSTLEIIAKYKDRIAQVISEKDKGIYDAMNKGISLSHGEFLHFLNSDDWFHSPQVINELVKRVKEKNQLYHGKLVYHHQDGKKTVMGFPIAPADIRFELRGIHQPATFFPRIAFAELGGFNISYRIASDYDLIRRFVNKMPAHFFDFPIVSMSDSGASSKQILRGIKEDYRIAVLAGESAMYCFYKACRTWILLQIRYRAPRLFWLLKKIKGT